MFVDFLSFRFIFILLKKNSLYDIHIQGIMSLFYFNIIIIQKSENLCDRSWNKNENLMTRHNFIDILNWVIITSTIILLQDIYLEFLRSCMPTYKLYLCKEEKGISNNLLHPVDIILFPCGWIFLGTIILWYTIS